MGLDNQNWHRNPESQAWERQVKQCKLADKALPLQCLPRYTLATLGFFAMILVT
ncbi:conserved hypothetical protein [Xanthomonas euvesicatoria pv. vesicatoria str. 85-10]|uniref:Uncharacterized protein n=1 Tax=Xanthomonas euvesicatoria pv. vesicatoria (strain 85-10) TaxID=316273 RepID=Q3BS46_XANE5|nr:conserved hypothetical protein [Xanthomonas euvesicatoria pv. vesicatoria str. 85-10]